MASVGISDRFIFERMTIDQFDGFAEAAVDRLLNDRADRIEDNFLSAQADQESVKQRIAELRAYGGGDGTDLSDSD